MLGQGLLGYDLACKDLVGVHVGHLVALGETTLKSKRKVSGGRKKKNTSKVENSMEEKSAICMACMVWIPYLSEVSADQITSAARLVLDNDGLGRGVGLGGRGKRMCTWPGACGSREAVAKVSHGGGLFRGAQAG